MRAWGDRVCFEGGCVLRGGKASPMGSVFVCDAYLLLMCFYWHMDIESGDK